MAGTENLFGKDIKEDSCTEMLNYRFLLLNYRFLLFLNPKNLRGCEEEASLRIG